ncbi:MAG: riboflavin synthase [Dehalococcoidia bacterium]|nr:riboflavin synthase [Dehalococcoidia bacterium]
MFTGIVEELGTVLANEGERLRVAARTVLADVAIGDSVAVNGACLTVIAFDAESFEVGVVPETLRRTNLGRVKPGDAVNLERSLAANGRIGGHFVQGHVDGVGVLASLAPEANGVIARFTLDPALARYVVAKGFIAVDGVSLTVVESGPDYFTVALIPHTRAVTTLGRRAVGDPVNLEVDILGKYVERFVSVGNETATSWLSMVTGRSA